MPVRISGDTIIYNSDSFTNGTEKKLEDVLKKVQKQISRDIRRIKRENAIRLCQQTIEWRSTLMDFVRFELKKKTRSTDRAFL